MLFNSFEFVLFYVVVLVAFFAMQQRYRWMLLLAASYYFYMCWKVEYVVLIIASTLVDYFVGLALARTKNLAKRRVLLASSVVTNLGILFTFKYWNFFGDSLDWLCDSLSLGVHLPGLELLLPVGISFYTFQSMSYTIDVYCGKTEPERHLGIFAVYVAFFPQLVAGPIERSGRLLPQFREKKQFSYDRAQYGLQRMLWGCFKKVVIADQLAPVVDAVYSSPESFSGPFLLLASIFFAIQIYCDFSGYSDIAIGCAAIMGFDLMTNFRRPYFARSLADFWHRWHISLSTWFRDYLYFPLGGNRVAFWRWCLNIVVVFTISGLWHGAAWTFVAWGALHGAALLIEAVTSNVRESIARALWIDRLQSLRCVLQIACTASVVLVGWIFFRADSLQQALYILRNLASFDGFSFPTLFRLGLPRFEMMIALLSIGVLFTVDLIGELNPAPISRAWSRRPFRWATYFAGVYSIVFFGVLGRIEFIYFQF